MFEKMNAALVPTIKWGPLAMAGLVAVLGATTLASTVQAKPLAEAEAAELIAGLEDQADAAEQSLRDRLAEVRTSATGLESSRIEADAKAAAKLTSSILTDGRASQTAFSGHDVADEEAQRALDTAAEHAGEVEGFAVSPTGEKDDSYAYRATFTADEHPAWLSFTTDAAGVLTSYTLTWAPAP